MGTITTYSQRGALLIMRFRQRSRVGLPSLLVEPFTSRPPAGRISLEMSDAPVRRTALEVTDFLVNHLTGAEMPHAWDEFTSVPIVDPRLEGIRLRCVQLENERPDVRVSELRNALRLLQHLQHVHHI